MHGARGAIPSGRSGFTLVELAMVFIIMAILAGVLVPLVFTSVEQDKSSGARQELFAVKDQIIGYFVSPPAQDKGAPNADQVFLPASSYLAGRVDAWNHAYLYVAEPALLKDTLTRPSFCRMRTTTLSVRTQDGVIANVAFIVGSHGRRPVADVDFTATPVDLAQETDDIVEWVTLSELVLLACRK